jgi:proteic killer suppression protein
MIVGFRSPETERIWRGFRSRRYPPEIQALALRKLRMLHAAADLNDLRRPPGNRLQRLVGDRAGEHSIRVNDQWRICFVWPAENNADEVEIVDYH